MVDSTSRCSIYLLYTAYSALTRPSDVVHHFGLDRACTSESAIFRDLFKFGSKSATLVTTFEHPSAKMRIFYLGSMFPPADFMLPKRAGCFRSSEPG